MAFDIDMILSTHPLVRSFAWPVSHHGAGPATTTSA